MLALGWGLGLFMTMLTFSLSLSGEAGRTVQATRAVVAAWPQPMNGLPVAVVGDCGQGPSSSCAVVVAPVPEDGDAMVRVWPFQNWAKAWLPLSAWKVAHAAALRATDSAYGQRLVAAGPEGLSRVPDPALARRTNAHPSWRLSMLVPAQRPERSAAVEQGPAPSVQAMPYGPVLRFDDGMELPARQDGGRWYVLAQGPMSEALRMTRALMGLPDSGPSPAGPSSVAHAVPSVPPVVLPSPAPAVPTNDSASPAGRNTTGRNVLTLDPSTLLPMPRPDRDDDARAQARDGLRSPRPALETGTAQPPFPRVAPAAPGAVPRADEEDGRTRDRERLRNLSPDRRTLRGEDLSTL